MTEAGASKRLGAFERFLTLWVFLCMVAGVAVGKLLPGFTGAIRGLELGEGTQINLAIAILIWLMVYPMMLEDRPRPASPAFGKRPKGLAVTLFVNWLVKPFCMALLAWFFFRHAFAGLIAPASCRPVRRRD